MKPSIGRIVHYKDSENIVSAAIITGVNGDGTVNLYVFRDEPLPTNQEPFRAHGCDMAEGPRQAGTGQWWWPERI